MEISKELEVNSPKFHTPRTPSRQFDPSNMIIIMKSKSLVRMLMALRCNFDAHYFVSSALTATIANLDTGKLNPSLFERAVEPQASSFTSGLAFLLHH